MRERRSRRGDEAPGLATPEAAILSAMTMILRHKTRNFFTWRSLPSQAPVGKHSARGAGRASARGTACAR